MSSKAKLCTVCLKNDLKLIEANQTDNNNIKWSCKLEFCVPEVEWDECCSICYICLEQLDAAYTFRNLCLQSNGSCIKLGNWKDQKTITSKINNNNSSKQKLDDYFTCYVCSKNFAIKSNLIKHIKTHSINRCGLCKEQFTTNTQLQLHNIQVHNETKEEEEEVEKKQSECKFCSRSFKSSVSLNQHIRRIHQKEFSIDNDVKVEEYDLKTEEETEEKFKIDENYECFEPENDDDDDNNSIPETKPQQQQQQRGGRSKFLCEECKNVFVSSKKLLDHAVTEHGFDPSIIKPFNCDKCESKFSSSSNLLQHKKYHLGKRTHICTFCGKGYITKSDLNTHEKQHLNKREYQCLDCPKTFNTHKDLRSHRLVVHTDPSLWNYVCSFCQKRFPIKSNLDQHMRRHTGEKRFGCHICEKRFVDKIVMQKHIKSHSNFRAFKCEHCEKEYKDNKVLEIHLTKIHGIGNAKIPIRVKKHFCHVCPKSYFAKNKLTRHMFSHTGEKPYICHICERKFTDKSYVKQHLKTTHNVFDIVDDNK